MNRNTGWMVGCLAVGAVLMYAATNLRVRVEVAGSPEAAAQPHAPARLPDAVANPVRRPLAFNRRAEAYLLLLCHWCWDSQHQ